MDTNLYLVGFMGTGKSTVGRLVARQVGFDFVDSDHEIERLQGKPVSQIFAEQGEAAFRAMERGFVERGHPAKRCVVSCGGGLIVPPGMLELLRGRGVVVCMHAPIDTIIQRTLHATHRPLLAVENPEQRLRDLYAQREALYRRSGTLVLTDKRPLREIAAHVLRVYRQEAASFGKK
ncbi:shikimate kinase [Oleiharenicola lentus]|jgi:shikimate kinase|uniref:Shikimate kinase n=1 Tax=Oleiharenicola lentus TaxID=2508720 RepID=A0A4Q1C4N6_9BACT|nr:shikimate kinase [Oleiharenicola lentus]RXK53229.1 shikimate kinase [Oleiharenicola lentus]